MRWNMLTLTTLDDGDGAVVRWISSVSGQLMNVMQNFHVIWSVSANPNSSLAICQDLGLELRVQMEGNGSMQVEIHSQRASLGTQKHVEQGRIGIKRAAHQTTSGSPATPTALSPPEGGLEERTSVKQRVAALELQLQALQRTESLEQRQWPRSSSENLEPHQRPESAGGQQWVPSKRPGYKWAY
eukprot:62135-Amphidinium_carterae.3